MALIRCNKASTAIDTIGNLQFTTSDGYVEITGITVGTLVGFAMNTSKSGISSTVGLTEISSDDTADPASCVVLYRATATTVRVNSNDNTNRMFLYTLT